MIVVFNREPEDTETLIVSIPDDERDEFFAILRPDSPPSESE